MYIHTVYRHRGAIIKLDLYMKTPYYVYVHTPEQAIGGHTHPLLAHSHTNVFSYF